MYRSIRSQIMIPVLLLLIGFLSGTSLSLTGIAAQKQGKTSAEDRPEDRAAIREATASFVKAFERGDAEAVAAHWTENGEYVAEDGTAIRGREAIAKTYRELFKEKAERKAEVEPTSLRFQSSVTAVEEGYFKVRTGKGEPTESRYSVLHVKENGKWRMAIVREWPVESASLRDLAWLIGRWETRGDGNSVTTTYEWWKNKSFIRAEFTIKTENRTLSGFQMIGKDPSTGNLRSWTFSTAGDFGEATWTRESDRKWVQEAAGVREDGSVVAATNVLKKLDDNTFIWQSMNRTLNGVEVEGLAPIKITRVKESK